MALPPEQINIKRRREEEPVETLFIQSALHQTKRRFTDFVFQRVPLKASDFEHESNSNPSTPSGAHPAVQQRLLRSPRSVSSLHVNRRAPQPFSSNGIPQVRATSPGAELRDAQRRAAVQREIDAKRKRALRPELSVQSSPTRSPPSEGIIPTGPGSVSVPVSVLGSENSRPSTPSSRAASVRRFQISRTSTPLGQRPGGIQKRRAEGSPGVAVLVEQLQRTQHSRKASMVADLVGQAQVNEKGIVVNATDTEPATLSSASSSSPVKSKPRKRPVINQAEKKWREQRKGAVSAAKQHLSETLEKSAQAHSSTWDEESDRLARDFENIALELENEMVVDSNEDANSAPPYADADAPAPAGQAFKPDYSQFAMPTSPKPLKYQPRLPKQPRVVESRLDPAVSTETANVSVDGNGNTDANANTTATATANATQAVDDNDEDYVYDVYIRRPLAESDMLRNPLAELESDKQLKDLEASRAGVGVIVITAEDEEYWENFIEDDEEEWDSEDADSNAENNPANDYPDEELSSSDEDDDPSAIYAKYRRHGMSDDEEFDFDDSGSESGARFGSGSGSAFGYRQRYGGHVDSDDESD